MAVNDVFADRAYMKEIVDGVKEDISCQIQDKMNDFHQQLVDSANFFRTELAGLRSTTVEINKQRQGLEGEIQKLRDNIVKFQYEDGIRSNELLKALRHESSTGILPSEAVRLIDVDNGIVEYQDKLDELIDFETKAGKFGSLEYVNELIDINDDVSNHA